MSTTTRKFKTVITDTGAKKLAQAAAPDGKPVRLTHMAVGDGGGTLPTPDSKQIRLVHEVWRHTVNRVILDATHQNRIIAELVIPPETGGFWIREIGVFDEHGDLIAVGNTAESYKPTVAEGSGRAQTFRTILTVSSTATVALTVDNTMVMATVDYVDDKLKEHEQSRRHPDASLTTKGFTQLSSDTTSTSETRAATPKAIKIAMDNADGRLAKNRNGEDIPNKELFLINVGTPRVYAKNGYIGKAGQRWTTEQFVEWLNERGAFRTGSWIFRANISLSQHCVLTDTGYGDIGLGGCLIEVFGEIIGGIVRITTGLEDSDPTTKEHRAQFTGVILDKGKKPSGTALTRIKTSPQCRILAHYPQQVTQYLQVNWKQHTPSVVLLLMAQRELKHYHREYLCRGRQIRRLTVTLSWWGRLLTNQHTRNLQ